MSWADSPDFQHSMTERRGMFCDPDAVASMREEVAPHLKTGEDKPLEHQLHGLLMMRALESGEVLGDAGRGGVLADEPGMGKTLAALLHMRMSSPDRPMAVLAPKILVEKDTGNWWLEIDKWLRDTRRECIVTPEEVQALAKRAPEDLAGLILLVGTESVARSDRASLWPIFGSLDLSYLVVDEGSMLGTEGTVTADMVQKMKGRTTIPWIISATPFKEKSEADFVATMMQYYIVTTPHGTPSGPNEPLVKKRRTSLATSVKRAKKMAEREFKNADRRVKMGFIIRHSAKEIEGLLPRREDPITTMGPADDAARLRLNAIIAAKQRMAIICSYEDGGRSEKQELDAVLSLASLPAVQVRFNAPKGAFNAVRAATSQQHADTFAAHMDVPSMMEDAPDLCGVCDGHNILPLWWPCCKRTSSECNACVAARLYRDKAKSPRAIQCRACSEETSRDALQLANSEPPSLSCRVTQQDQLRLTRKGAALLQMLRRSPESKVLLAGVTGEERRLIAAMLDQKEILHCITEDSAAVGDRLRTFVDNPAMRVMAVSKSLKQGVDELKVADTVLFWSEYHDDWTQPTQRLQIIKRVHRLGCKHKTIKVVRFRMEPLEEDGPRPVKLHQLRMAAVTF